MTTYVECDRCHKRCTINRHEVTIDEGDPQDLCDSCGRDLKRFMAEPPPEAGPRR